MAAIALARLHHYTGDAGYRDKAEQTLETFAGVAEQFGIFAATYGIAVAHWLENPLQVVVIDGEGVRSGRRTYAAAVAPFAFNKTTLRLAAKPGGRGKPSAGSGGNIPELSQIGSGKSFAVICSGSACQPPVFDAAELHAMH